MQGKGGGSSLAPPSPTPPTTARFTAIQLKSPSGEDKGCPPLDAGIGFQSGREPRVSPPRQLSPPPLLPPPPGEQVRRLHFAAAAGPLLLRLDVVVDLELGLVGLLRRSVLQLPGRHTDGETERERYRK